MFGATPAAALQKRCPSCNRYYDDATQIFCLDDGTSLVVPREVEPPPTLVMPDATRVAAAAVKSARVFISYKRNSDPDEQTALAVFDALGAQHDVFIDQKMQVGTRWANCIEAELRRSDYLVVFLSAQSINSEMVWGEIKMAHQLAKERGGRPTILPVRLDYAGSFPYPLNTILDEIQWLDWHDDSDTEQVVSDLLLVLSGGDFPADPRGDGDATTSPDTTPTLPLPEASPSFPVKMRGRTVPGHSEFYVARESDDSAERAIEAEGVTITIKGPRQMGKTSLLNRVMDAARRNGKKVVFLDFQLLDQSTLSQTNLFYPHFCSWLTDKLELDDCVYERWERKPYLTAKQKCTMYVRDCLLKEIGGPLLIAMDEVDRIFDADFRDDFFSMLRNWHNERARDSVWAQLDLALVTSTEPYQLIEDLNQSPFNVGEIIDLDDFNAQQLSKLNSLYGSPFNPEELGRLMMLLSGHPYLVHRAIYLVACGRSSVADLFKNASNERGPFGDHLRHHFFRLYDKRDLVAALRKVINNGTTLDERIFFRLRGAGLVKRRGRAVVPRCQLYADYFREYL